MKKIILTLTIIVVTSSLYGQVTQPDSTKKEYKNVIGLDVTGLIGQFLNLNIMGYYYYYYPYMFSYKRLFKNNAIRFGVGGNINTSEGITNDTITGTSAYNNFNIGLGYEHYSHLSKKWIFYFGVDAISAYSIQKYTHDHSTTESSSHISTTYYYGGAPLFGMVFRLNSRFSVATETSYEINYLITESNYTYVPPSFYNSKSKSTGIQTHFNPPTSIIIRLQL